MLYHFHAVIHVRPAIVVAGPELRDGNRSHATLRVEPGELTHPFAVSFEQAQEQLARLPRMFVEPDGSFVWVSNDPQRNWQVDGNLYDRDERLLYVELSGRCPQEAFDQLLESLGWPRTPLVFQLLQQAVLLEEAVFRGFVARA